MENCYTGTSVPEQIQAPCNGEYISTACVATPTSIPSLSIPEGGTQNEINNNIAQALIYKEQQIQELTASIDSLTTLVNQLIT